MSEEQFIFLSKLTYYFLGFSAFEIIISIPFSVGDRGQIRSRISNKFVSTVYFALFAVIIAIILFFIDDSYSDELKSSLADFTKTLYPLTAFSISFFLFYLSRVWLQRRWFFPLTIIPLIIAGITIILTIFMITNGNELTLIQK